MKKKRIGILTGGGDVQPLNAVMFAANKACEELNTELIGFKYGWQGLLDLDFISLSNLAIDLNIGGTLLKSSRVNLAKVDDGSSRVMAALEKLALDGLIVIGGEDTLSNAFLLKDYPIALISKTIDNDVGLFNDKGLINHFTLGYPTAASKISSFVSLNEGLRTTAYSHERIIVVESMGMHAGWLALSSSLGSPDFIIIPEFPLNYDYFLEMVRQRYELHRNVITVIAEGSRWDNNMHISADETEKDSFGHPKFKGAAEVLAKRLKSDLKKYFDTRNVNSVNPSYLYRSGKPNELDLAAGLQLGAAAVEWIFKRQNHPVFLVTAMNGKEVKVAEYDFRKLNNIEDFHRFINGKFYDPEKLNVTDEALKYLVTIAGKQPELKYTIK